MTDPERDRWFLSTLMRLHVTAKDSGGSMTVVEQRSPAGFSPPLHVHAHEDACIVVLEGALRVVVGDTELRLGPGGSAFLPRGVPHTFLVEADARIIEVATPGGADGFYAENGEPAGALVLPPPNAWDFERLVATARARGIETVGPPLA